MYSAIERLTISPSEKLVVMPLTRVLIEDITYIGQLTIFPPGELDILELQSDTNLVQSGDQHRLAGTYLEGQDLRLAQTLVTGFDVNSLHASACVCFAAEIDWDILDAASHVDDIALLSRLSAMAERSFDVLRLHYCRLDLPDTLPGLVGVWEDASLFMGALIYCPSKKRGRLIAGKASSYSTITCGIGLDLTTCSVANAPLPFEGEVSAIAVHALSLLSDAMHARNDTAKFVRVMTLLEFLGSPDEYRQWKKLKGDIACHRAKDQAHYLQLLNQLRSFTSADGDAGEQIGYRTLVVHHGKFLEDVLPDVNERRKLFGELQIYCHCVIDDMIKHREMTWNEFVELRCQFKQQLGIQPRI